jgi:hypothetical protein
MSVMRFSCGPANMVGSRWYICLVASISLLFDVPPRRVTWARPSIREKV